MDTYYINNCEYLYTDCLGIHCKHPNNFTQEATCNSPCLFLLEDKLDKIEKKLNKFIEEKYWITASTLKSCGLIGEKY